MAPEAGAGQAIERADQSTALLRVEDLSVQFATSRGTVRAVERLSYHVNRGEILAIVGESGCGKSVSSLAIMRLLPKQTARIPNGRILFDGVDLLTLGDEQMRTLRGREIAMIFQEPMTSLNPVLSIGAQIMEPLFIHLAMTQDAARARAIDLLAMVGITDPERRLDQYPHQFSGGMRQRVMIAIGLACNPKLIIADEPTTALDVTIQAQILELMQDLCRRLDIALVVITHNLGIVARYADRVQVMYAGEAVEQGVAEAVFADPRHPYTEGLLRSIPRLDRPKAGRLATIEGLPPNLLSPPTGCRFAARCPYTVEACGQDQPLLAVAAAHWSRCGRSAELHGRPSGWQTPATGEKPVRVDAPAMVAVTKLAKHFEVGGRLLGGGAAHVKAVDGVSFTVQPGETLGLVGESGCGKSTVGRLLLKLETPTEGEIAFEGVDLAGVEDKALRDVRRRIQVIFQDPFASLNPRMTCGQIIAEPLLVYRLVASRQAARARVAELLGQVGLYDYMAERYPHELSGGQRQRVGIARALAMEPRFIVCDEPVSALDVSIQGQIINLLEDLQHRLGLTYLFIAHDLAVVRHIADRVAVMYLGRMMEVAPRDALYAEPLHPYTQALLDAAPVPDPVVEKARAARTLGGELPSPLKPPPGCVFNTRCARATDACREIVPTLEEKRPGHWVACIHVN